MSERTEAIYNSIRNNYGRLANGARPWENNRDEMNDVLNYAPTEGQQTYSIGTDDAGNEILGNTVNDFMAQPQPKEEDNSFFAGTSWGGDINAAEASERILADEEGGETNLPELIDGGRVDLGQELSALHDRMKDTSLYAQYMYSADDWAEKGKEIFDATGMDVNSLGDKNIFEKAWNLTREIKRQKALATDASGHVNMDKVYEAMPYLRDIHEAHGTAAAVMVMNSAKELQTINDVYDSEAARFAASIGYGIYRGGLSVVNQYTGAKAMARGLWSNKGLTQEEMNDILWVSNEMKKLPQNSYSSFGSILGGVLGSAAENAPTMLPEMIRTAAVNLGKLTGPAGMAASAGVYALMSAQIGGAQYIENITKTDENGNPIYTPRQAALLSAFQGFAEAALEKRSIAAAGKAVFSAGTAKKLSELAAKDVALASGQTMSGVTREAAREILRERIQHGFKAGILSGAAELEEEFEQQISDMVLENMAQIAFRGGEADVSSVDEILSEAFDAAVEALPAVAGFGFMGAGGSVVADTERVLSMRERFANAKASEIARGIYENQHQQNIVYNVAENLDNVQELQGKAPEIVTEILDAQNKKAGAEDTDVNIGMLMQKDGGADIVNQIAAENGTSQEDVQACINGTGFLTVKTSALQQAIHKMTPEQQQAVFPNLAAVGHQTNEQILSYARDMKAALDAVKDKTDKETAATIERFVRESFEDEDTRKTAAEIIASDTDNPYEAAKRRVRANQADVDEYLKDTIDALKSEAGQGTSVVETMDENGDVTTGRASNNPLWYQNFYADNGKAPTNADYERIAYENVTGTATRYVMMSYGNLTPEDVAYFEGVKNELDALLSEKERLRTIADALKGFGKGDFLPTASMPAETRQAYNSIYQILSASDNKKVRDNARVNAILAARMLSRLGFMWKDDAGRDVNLMEILPKLAANAVYQAQDKSALMQEMTRQIDEVRAKYEGTEQWMKAPNGEPTKLTEEQWLTVRTDAFKNWFGDWEKSKKDRSKVLDENGEPKVVHHGTGRADRVGSVFLPERATSGPMAFFTDSFDIATNYSKNKQDTSLSRDEDDYLEYKNQFTVQIEGRRNPMKIGDAWWYLPKEQRDKIAELAPSIGLDENEEIAIIPGNKSGLGGYDYHLKQFHGNHMKALIEEWLQSAALFDEEEKFLQVLKLAGLDNVKYNDPRKREEAVYSVFLDIRKPFDATNINKTMLKKLEVAARKAQKTFNPAASYNADSWDKTSMPPDEWIEHVHDDIKNGTTYAWTVVPDFVTETLKKAGYDGIQDLGGKRGGEGHTVYIPFTSTQVKSATGNNGQFLVDDPNIYHQSAYDVRKSGVNSLVDFHDKIEERKAQGKPENKIKFTSPISGIIFSEEQTVHATEKHGLTNKNLADIEKHIGEIQNIEISATQPGRFHGISVLGKVIGDEACYGVVLEISVDGEIHFKTAFKTTESNAEAWIKKEKNAEGLSLSKDSAGTDGRSSKSNIQEFAEEVNKHAELYEKFLPKWWFSESVPKRVKEIRGNIRNLIAYHNIDEENLMRAAELGGLPVPSIAITRKDIPFTQFGKITLIGNADLIDPSRSGNVVYNRDAWTTRFPEITYDRVKIADMEALLKTLDPAYEKLGEEGQRERNSLDSSLRNNRLRQMVFGDLYNSAAMQYDYVTKELGKSVKLPFKKVKSSDDALLKYKKVRDAIEEIGHMYHIKENREKFTKIIKPYLDKYINTLPEDMRAIYQDMYYKDGEFNHNLYTSLLYHAKDYGKTKLQIDELKNSLYAQIRKSGTAKYEAFVNKKLDAVYKNPQIMIGKKKSPVTLENVVTAMIKQRGAAKEESLTYGDSKVLAALAKKYGSLNAIRKNKDKLTDSEKAEVSAQEFKDAISAYRDEVLPHYKFQNSTSRFDEANMAIADAAKNGGTRDAIKYALQRHDFENITEDMIDAGAAVIEAAKDVKTDYFEAKPLRAVEFNEFSAAVVPEGTSQKAIDYLASQGLTIKMYDPNVEGDRQRAIQEVQTEQPDVLFSTNRGAFSTTQRLIQLFQDADESTFMHEMSHFYLNELQKIAMNAGENSQAAKDLATINGWAEWKEGDAEEYKGTASASEFAKLEAEILKAEKDGNEKEAARLKNVWRQEKFARGFEEYLHEGKAPTSTLKRIFRRFRDWLKQIYKDVTGAGVKPSAEVEAVFARMIASDEEIEMQATIDRAADISRIDPDLMDADTEAMHERWAEEAKEEAKDKLRKELLKEQREKDIAAHMEAYEAEERERLQEIPAFQAELFVQEAGLPEEEAAEAVGYTSAEAWKEDLKELGGSYENAVKMSCDAERDRYIREMPNDVHLQELAEEALVSSEYAGRLASLEAEALRRREKKYANAPKRLAKAMEGMEAALADEKEEPLEKALRTLKYSFRWQRQQQEQIEAMQSTIDEMKARIARDKEASAEAAAQSEADKEALREKMGKQAEKGKERLRAKLKEQVNTFKAATMLNAEWLRGVRDAADGLYKMNRELAQQQLAAMPVKDSTNVRRFINDARRAAAESARAIANAVRKNNGMKKEDTGEQDYEKAKQAKLRQALFGAQAREALNLRRELQRLVNHLKRREKTLAKEKRGEIDASTKYYINHILYMMGLKKTDAIRPQTLESFGAHIASLKDAWDADNEANGNVGDLDMDFDVPDWLLNLATSGDKQPPGNYREFTMAELQDVKTLVDILYTTGRNKNRLLSMDRNKDEVVFELMQDFDQTVTVEEGDTGISSVMASLLQPVVMLKTLGPKWKQYFYDTLADAWERKTAMQQQAAQDLNALFEKHWNKKTRRKMRTKKLGITLPDGTELTKENVLSMALNWGNDGNRKRLMNGFSLTERDVEEIFKQTMTVNDWAFIQEAWDYINTYGDKVNEVVEKSTGTPMKRVEPRSFIVETEDGKTISLRGGYYPISYDPVKSLGHAEQELMSASQAMGGASAFGTGMGSTKARSENGLQESPLLLSADVLFRHVNQQIHIATMRLACRDVYKLLNDYSVRGMITSSLGNEAYKELKRWVENCWQEPRGANDWVSRAIGFIRGKTVTAIMAYRTSVAFLNLANPAYMARELGAWNALCALKDFYSRPFEIKKMRKAILEQSPFMANRANNIDRDIRKAQENSFAPGNPLTEMISEYGSWAIEETDMFCSMPTYHWTYKQTLNAELEKGTKPEDAKKKAHRAAEDVVRKIFGSADTVDQSAMQRQKNEFIKALTPFYTFVSTQANAIFEGYLKGRYQGSVRTIRDDGTIQAEKKAFLRRYWAMANAFLWTNLIGTLAEQILRDAIGWMTGDDDDGLLDPTSEAFLRRWTAQSMTTFTSAVPIGNIMGEAIVKHITGKYYGGRNFGVADAALGRFGDAISAAFDLAEGKKDVIDAGRSVAKAIGGSYAGMPDTFTDAIFNAARAYRDNYSLNEWFIKSLFDKKLKKKGR